jgi:hypothetical protein
MNLETAKFFRDEGYQSPLDPMNTPAQRFDISRGKAHMIELIARNAGPDALSSMMATWMLDRPHWSDPAFYPVKERLIDGAVALIDEKSVFLVDIGGSAGHDAIKFLANHPAESLPGDVLVEDLPHVIEGIKENSLPPAIRAVAHDFWTPQPIQGMNTPSLQYIWPDKLWVPAYIFYIV